MKKYFYLFAAAAVALASCSSDDTIAENSSVGNQQQKEIALSAFAQKATRAAISDGTYPDNQVMQVAAYSFPKTSSWAAGGYFDKTPFNGTNATNWTGTPKRYWPLSDAYVSFLAVTGVDAEDITFDQTEYSSVKHYASGAAVVYDAASFTAQGDLMYSGKQEEVTKSGNTLTYPDDADMVFKHALAQLNFKIRVPNAATYTDVIDVTSIVVNGAYQTGTFTITNTGYDTAGDPTPTGTWGSFGSATATTVPSSSYTAALPNDGTYADCGNVLLVPQASPTTSFTSFTINFTMHGKAYSFEYTPASTVLAQATKYIYNITFTLNEIIIDPVVTTWADGGSTDIAIPTPAP